MRAAYQTRLLLNGGGALLAGAGALLLGWSLLNPIDPHPPAPSSQRVEPRRLIGADTSPVESSVNAAVLAIPERRFQQPVVDLPPPPPPPMLAAAPLPSVQLPREVRLVGVVYSEDVAQRVALIRVSESAVETRMTGEALTAHPSVVLKSIDRQSVVLVSQGTTFSLKVPQEASQSFFKPLP